MSTNLTEVESLRYALRSLLSSNVVSMKFTKVNGEVRTMRCTTDLTLIPSDHRPKGVLNEGGEKVVQTSQMRVYDVDAKGWRSFKLENVIQFAAE